MQSEHEYVNARWPHDTSLSVATQRLLLEYDAEVSARDALVVSDNH
jgi:hypothetical protein